MSESSRGILTFYFPLVVLLPYCVTKHKERKKVFPGGSDGKASTCHPLVGKIPWRRKWQPTPGLLSRKFRGCRSLVGYSPWGLKESHNLNTITEDVCPRYYFHIILHSRFDTLLPHLHLRRDTAAARSEGYIWLLFSLSSMSSPTHWLMLYTS